jgi:dienelactone hydrolase
MRANLRDQSYGIRRCVMATAVAIVSIAVSLAGVVSPSAFAHSGATPTAAGAAFRLVGARRSFDSAPRVHEWTYELQRGPSPFDRIGLHRVSLGPAAEHPGIVMLYLPGTSMNGEVAVDDPHYSLPLYLAGHGVDFWALDYRTHFIPPAARAADLAELKGWNNDLFESDIGAAADFVRRTTGRAKIFVAGFSRGVSFAYLFAARHPAEIEGLVLFDGWIPLGLSAAAPPPDRYADDIGGAHLTYGKRQALMAAVIANPEGPAPIPKYKSARRNLEAVVYGAGGMFGGHGGLANPAGGYSDAVVLARMLIRYDRYWPTVQDYENSFTPADLARLSSSMIPVLAFSSTNIGGRWPARVAKSAASTGSAQVTVKTLEGWGHLDVICGTQSEAEVFVPTLAFLRAHGAEKKR